MKNTENKRFEVGKCYFATENYAVEVVAISYDLSALRYRIIKVATGDYLDEDTYLSEYLPFKKEEGCAETFCCTHIPDAFRIAQISAAKPVDLDKIRREREEREEQERKKKERAREEEYMYFLEKVSDCHVTLKQLVSVLDTFVCSDKDIMISDWILEKIRQEYS